MHVFAYIVPGIYVSYKLAEAYLNKNNAKNVMQHENPIFHY